MNDFEIYGFQRKSMPALMVWSVGSILSGLVVIRSWEKQRKGMGSQFIAWGLINGLIAWFGWRGAQKKQLARLEGVLTEYERVKETAMFEKIFWINAGLDVGYILGGSWLKRKNSRDDFKLGMGLGVQIQGNLPVDLGSDAWLVGSPGARVTYFEVLSIFVVPPLVVLAIITPWDVWNWLAGKRPKPDLTPYLIVLAHVFIALIYTTPWDNYLVATNVWWYNPQLVTGIRIGWVPIEEYAFFILQTLLTGLLTVWLIRHFADRALAEPAGAETGPDGWKLRMWGSLGIGLVWAASIVGLILGWETGTYLTLILTWALIPVLLQAIFGLDILLRRWRVLVWGIIPPTIYLWVLDWVALSETTWTIDPLQTTGLKVGVIPIEEMLFFFMTNLIIVFGVTLMFSQPSQERARDWVEKWKIMPVKQWMWLLALVIWLLAMIFTPISIWRYGDGVFVQLATVGVLAQFGATIIALWIQWGTRKTLATFGLVGLLTWMIEVLGVKTGLPFGAYRYSDAFKPELGGVPLMIPLAWLMMLVPAWAVSQIVMTGLSDRLGGVKSGRYRLAYAVIAGMAFTAWDLYLDPQMVRGGLWEWERPGEYFGIPLSNYFGWWISATALTWIIQPTGLETGRLVLIYILTWLFQAVGLGIFWDQPGPALTGFVGMGIFSLWVIRKEGFGWGSFSGLLQGSSAAPSHSR